MMCSMCAHVYRISTPRVGCGAEATQGIHAPQGLDHPCVGAKPVPEAHHCACNGARFAWCECAHTLCVCLCVCARAVWRYSRHRPSVHAQGFVRVMANEGGAAQQQHAVCQGPDCEKVHDLKMCVGCHSAAYCSRSCQRAHWKAGHKRECKRLKAMLAMRGAVAGVPQEAKAPEEAGATSDGTPTAAVAADAASAPATATATAAAAAAVAASQSSSAEEAAGAASVAGTSAASSEGPTTGAPAK